jgi:hypothetical protein
MLFPPMSVGCSMPWIFPVLAIDCDGTLTDGDKRGIP